MDGDSRSSGSRPRVLEDGRQYSDPPNFQIPDSTGDLGHIRLDEPKRPKLSARNTLREQSTKSFSEALRLARSREEQETLLGDEEQADDDGCFPPRTSDAPRAPNPHKDLPIYATIHKIRRLVIASIGTPHSGVVRAIDELMASLQTTRTV